MSRPDDIPEALWESREVLAIASKPVGARELVCRAILAAEQRVREECAQKARDWLTDWADELYSTFESYVEAKTTGRHGGRRIPVEMADMFAKQFRERADAVANCAAPIAAAIRKGGGDA